MEMPGLMLWRHRWLLLSLLRRELRSRYVGTIGGPAWALLHPMLMLAIYAAVFQYVFEIRMPHASRDQPYVLWVALALWPWLAFSEALSRGTVAVQQHGDLVKKVAFPQELLVYSAVLSSLTLHAVGYAIVVSLLWLWGLNLDVASLLPVALWAWIVLGCAATGLALVLGALHVFLRDVEQLLGQVLSAIFFASPILYSIALVPEPLRAVVTLNPLTHVFEPIRLAGLGHAFPQPLILLTAFAGAILLWLLGLAWFRRLSPHFEDQL